MRKRVPILWLAFAVCCRIPVTAQLAANSFSRFTTEQGLADNWVHDALQDSKGFMWFCTEGGLSRFDGEHFLNFYQKKGNSNSLSNNTVRGICEDPDGSLWLAVLDGGLNHFDPAIGAFESWKTDPGNPRFKGELTSVLQDGDLLWLGSYEHGLGCFDKKKRRYIGWYSFPNDVHADNSFQFNSVLHLIADRHDSRYLWLAAAGRGLARFDKQTLRLETWSIFDVKGSPDVAAMHLVQDKNGLVWIGTWSTGLAMFDPSTGKMTTYPYDRKSYDRVSYNRNVVLSLLEKNGTELWVATEDNGFGSFDKISSTYTFFKNTLNGESAELDRACQSLYLDPQQRLWVLGRQQGGARVFASQRQAIRYVSLAAGGGAFERDEVTGFAYSPSRRTVFVATENNGCFEWSDELGSLQQRAKPLPNGSFPNFKAVVCDAKGTVWAGASKTLVSEASLYRMEPGQSQFEVAVLNFGLPIKLEETVNSLLEDSHGNIWVATSYDGFYRINAEKGTVDCFREQDNFAKGCPSFNKWWALLDMEEDPQGHIWFALKSGGVLDFDPTTKRFNNYDTEKILPSNDVRSLEISRDGRIWLGTNNSGLQVFRQGISSKDSVRVLDSLDGLQSQHLSAIDEDGNGTLWMTTDKGLVAYNPIAKQFRMYGKTEGLRNTYLSGKGLTTIPGVGVLVGQPSGFCLLRNVENSAPAIDTLRVVLTDFRVFNQSKYFEKGIRNASEVELNPFEDVFAFEFAIPTSLDAGLASYEFRLDGFDEKWYAAEGGQSLTYSGLSPGSYVFRVKASLGGGKVSPETTLRIRLLPQWWQTWWARSAAVLAIILLLFWAYRYRTRQLKHEHNLQRQMNELERSALQAQMSPHFIFNCLGAIQNFILQNEKEQAMEYLGSFAKLVRGVLNACVTGKVSLQEELQLLGNYLMLERLRFDQRFDYEVKLDEDLGLPDNLSIPPLLIQPYVENAVLHGMAGKKSGGKVTVFFKQKGTQLEVTVQDNGHGSTANNLPKSHKSVGMTVTRRRLELLASSGSGGSVIVRQLEDSLGSISGTEVTINIGFLS